MKKKVHNLTYIVLFINLLFILLFIFGDKGGPCAPGIGLMLGLLVFAPLTLIGFIISIIFIFATKYRLAKEIAIVESITIAVSFLLIWLLDL